MASSSSRKRKISQVIRPTGDKGRGRQLEIVDDAFQSNDTTSAKGQDLEERRDQKSARETDASAEDDETEVVVTATQDEDGASFLPPVKKLDDRQQDAEEEPEENGFEGEDETKSLSTAAIAIGDFKSRLRNFAYNSPSSLNGSERWSGDHNNNTAPGIAKSTRSRIAATSADAKKSTSTSRSPSAAPKTTPATPSPRKRQRTASTTTPSRNQTRLAKRSLDPYNPTNLLTDAIRPDLHLLMIGLNPGLMTASTGHAYAHPSNLFWKLLFSSGLTSYRHPPSDTHALMDLYGIGNTNICDRPTRDGAGLSKQELEAGVPILEQKIRTFRPETVCIVGKGIWDVYYRVKKGKPQPKSEFRYGWQDEELWLGRRDVDDESSSSSSSYKGSRTFLATTTSGLAAGMKPAEKEAVWKILGDWILADRERWRRSGHQQQIKMEEENDGEDGQVKGEGGGEGVKMEDVCD